MSLSSACLHWRPARPAPPDAQRVRLRGRLHQPREHEPLERLVADDVEAEHRVRVLQHLPEHPGAGALAADTPVVSGIDGQEPVDVDDTIIEVHGHRKQGAGFGYFGVRGLNALLATATTPASAPVIVAQRLRKGAWGSPRGAARLVAEALATVKRLRGADVSGPVLLRADSAFYGHATISAAIKAGAAVSVTTRLDPAVKRAIATIGDDAWESIDYTDAIFAEETRSWISSAEVAEAPFTAFTSRKRADQVTGRLVGRRIPELNRSNLQQPTLFDTHRFHAFFTTSTLDTVTADKTHRGHAIIEQVNADLKHSALAHLPSGVFTANAAWLVLAVMAFNLTRAAATVTGPGLARATTGTIRRKLIAVAARIASSARKLTLHLPSAWPWGARGVPCSTPPADHRGQRPSDRPADTGATRNRRGTPRAARPNDQPCRLTRVAARPASRATYSTHRWIEAKHRR